MSVVAFIRRCLAAGMDADLALTAAEAFEAHVSVVIDVQAERRRAKDRERKRLRNSAESADSKETAESPRPLPLSPQTPQTPTPTPGYNTRATREREDAAFGRFWSAYPRKVGKVDARKAFTKAWRKLPPMDEEPILTGGLERAKAAWTDAQFIPHAATWLNGERWQDEPEPLATPANDRTPPRIPDKRRAAFTERLGDIDAAMAAAFEQPLGRH